MREIKFRAWDVKRGCYFQPSTLDFANKEYGMSWVHDGSKFITDVILEQYTGLHDKNGKEIYEGDIVGFYNRNNIFGIVEWDDHGMFIFRWDKDTAKKRREEYKDFIPTNLEMWEIIGNIHENPELLEEE